MTDKTGRRRRNFTILTVVVLVCGVVGSLHPALAPPGNFGFDKLVHLGAYGVLCFCLAQALPRSWPLWVAVAVAVAFGGGMELLQNLVPERSGSWGDAAFNLLGAGVGLLGLRVVPR